MSATQVQPIRLKLAVPFLLPYRCVAPNCKKNLALRKHITYLPSVQEPCPHCGERNRYIKLAVIHLIQPNRFGQIRTTQWAASNSAATEGDRLDFLCEKSRKGYKEISKSPNQPRHFTSVPEAATCYYCLREFNRTEYPRGKLVTEF